MAQDELEKGVWNGWYWRYIIGTVLVTGVLQTVIYYAFHWSILQNTLLGLLITIYLLAIRAKERRLANITAGVVVLFIVDILLQVFVERLPWRGFTWTAFAESNLLYLAISLVWAYLYLRLTEWSERKRRELEEKRAAEARPERPPVRRHHKRKKKRRR